MENQTFLIIYSVLYEMLAVNATSLMMIHLGCLMMLLLKKMGALMSENSGQLLRLYDELSTFLAQINLYRGRGLSDSHELAIFLQLYNGHQW